LEAAKTVARTLSHASLHCSNWDRSFSDSGFSVQIPTNDQQAILASIDRIQPQRGTSLANGILVSLDTIAGKAVRFLNKAVILRLNFCQTPTPVRLDLFHRQ